MTRIEERFARSALGASSHRFSVVLGSIQSDSPRRVALQTLREIENDFFPIRVN